MKRRKGTVWAVVISATLITAGLILSCGDGAATCKAACEKGSEYRIFEEFKKGPKSVEECVEKCKEGLEKDKEETMRLINCTMDNNSHDEIMDCLLKR